MKGTILASEWGSSIEGLSTLNRELAIQLAKFPEVKITFSLQLDWLCFPPKDFQIDIIVGHGLNSVNKHKSLKTVKRANGFKW